ncbi:Uma2 family endonuclease [Nocardia sp. NPDC005366]|uniref:Uma2 family endonuclease n=1 Tax=Nocardia sp. NPDC005366 TaxID=3156878 RepID=UPI0033A1BAF4
MSAPHVERPDLPEYMTWEELEQLPEEVATQIELWEGRVVWLRRGPAEHQAFTFALTSALKRCARSAMSERPERCWRVDFETNVFFGDHGKSDFVTPDFVAYRCLDQPYQDIRAADALLVGEVLSPSNKQTDIEDKKARYAGGGIPWYWEVELAPQRSEIAFVHAYALETTHGTLPPGVTPLHQANYILAGKWSPADSEVIAIDFPFPIAIPWTELEF